MVDNTHDAKEQERSGAWNRRELLGTAAAAVVPLVFPVSASAASRIKGANDRMNVACIGLGGQMQGHLREITANLKQNLIAVCDVDPNRIAESAKTIPDALPRAQVYGDYRKLLDAEKTLDAVIIATPDHWHAAICTAAIKASKHVYCEKPLTHSVADARHLRELSRKSRVVTQTGNQGSASGNMRRCMELIEAGLFGSIRQVHIWHPTHGWPSGVDMPEGADAIPAGFDWDFWLGPAPQRPYKNGLYHPVQWRGWYDFGSGSLGDFCCHAFNLPVRALKLEYPDLIEVSGEGMGKPSFITSGIVKYHFPERKGFDPVTLTFYTGGALPPADVTQDLKATYDTVPGLGCLLLGEKGSISAGLWNTDGLMKLSSEKTFRSVNDHEAAREIPVTLPRVEGHMREWVDACLGGPATFSNFDIGGHLTEIGLAGIVALRLGHDIVWDGKRMRVHNSHEAARLINPEPRREWRG
jgi:predicted dehydrogenase